MKCDNCENSAAYKLQGYRFCLSCARAFAGYTPDVLDEARQYLARMESLAVVNDARDHLALVLGVATAAQARAERAERERDAALERERPASTD